MSKIIAARFESVDEAEAAWAALQSAGFAQAQLDNFHLNAPGQNDVAPRHESGTADELSTSADNGALRGAVVGAVAAGVVGGVAAAALMPGLVVLLGLGSAAAGAYTGSLVGALNALPEKTDETGAAANDARQAGLLVAVRVDDPERIPDVEEILRRHGGLDVEQAEGTLREGHWSDFDPREPRKPIGPNKSGN